MAGVGLTAVNGRGRMLGMASIVVVGLVADGSIRPIGREFLTPLDEGMVMDMPITVPRISIARGVDDLKARDMILCRFPEVAMVVGKLGRAETPTDPAPLDMIETMVELHPRDRWPARALDPAAARRVAATVGADLARRGLIAAAPDLDSVASASLLMFDAQMREYAHQRGRELFRSPASRRPPGGSTASTPKRPADGTGTSSPSTPSFSPAPPA